VSLHRLAPGPALEFDLGTDSGKVSLSGLLAPPKDLWMRAIMVTTASGGTVDSRGSSEGLTQGDDRALLHLHRELSDAIVLGRRTLDRERIPIPRRTPLVILSLSGQIAADNLVGAEESEHPLVVVTSAGGKEHVHRYLAKVPHRVVVVDPQADAATVAHIIRTEVEGGRLLIEGGEQTWRMFASHCDDLWLAVTPPPTSARAGLPPWWPADNLPHADAAVYTDDARMLYYHHRLGRGAPPEDETPGL